MHFLIALGASLVLTPIVRRVGLAAGTVDRPSPGELKIRSQPVPFLGGVAVVGGAFGAMAVLGWPLPAAPVPSC